MEETDRSACALADELRRAIVSLVCNEVSLERLTRARELAVSLCAELEGSRRPRWYDADSTPGEPSAEAGHAYLTQSPICGRANPIAPPMVLGRPATRADGKPAVRASATLSSAYEGPPHGAHGGWVAALFDEVLGQAQRLVRKAGVTASLRVRYRDITPLDEELSFEAWIHEDRGRRVVARATCHVGETLTADAEAIFLGVDFDDVRGRMLERKDSDPRPV